MNEIPMWWLVLSGLFFFLNLVLAGVLCYVLLQLVQMAKRLEPEVKVLTARVNAIGQKVEGVATRVDELAVSLKGTVDNVGGRAQNVASSAELVAGLASRQFERFAPMITGVMTAIKLFNAFRAGRAAKSPPKPKELPRKS